jgi:hypothetical protein
MSRTPEGDALALACEKAWRLLDTGNAYGPDATKAMAALEKAVDAYMERGLFDCATCGFSVGHAPFCGLEADAQ